MGACWVWVIGCCVLCVVCCVLCAGCSLLSVLSSQLSAPTSVMQECRMLECWSAGCGRTGVRAVTQSPRSSSLHRGRTPARAHTEQSPRRRTVQCTPHQIGIRTPLLRNQDCVPFENFTGKIKDVNEITHRQKINKPVDLKQSPIDAIWNVKPFPR
jgi:hypothetical protein